MCLGDPLTMSGVAIGGKEWVVPKYVISGPPVTFICLHMANKA